MPLVKHVHPIAQVLGTIKADDGSRGISLWTNPHAGLIAGPAVPHPNAPTPTEQNIMDIHKLTGPQHSESGQVTGNFLKTTGPATFQFTPHGLAAADVGAAPAAAGVSGGNAHAHTGDPIAKVAHTDLTAIGTNTHAQVDTFIASKGAASGLTPLDANALVPDANLKPYRIWNTARTAAAVTADAAGNIGIAIAAATHLLHVEKSAAGAAVTAFVKNADNTNPASHARIYAQVGGANGGSPFFVAAVPGTAVWSFGLDNADADKFKISADTGFTATKLTILLDGKVGIGITAPTVALDIVGALKTTLDATIGGNITSSIYNVPRFRGAGAALPTDDLRDGDLFVHVDVDTHICLYGNGDWYSAPAVVL